MKLILNILFCATLWLNIPIKGEDTLSVLVAEILAGEKRLHQAFIAFSASAARKAREAVPEIMNCNMDRRESDIEYVKDSPDEIRMLFELGVDFPLVNNIVRSINVASELNIHPIKHVFAAKN